MFCRVSQLSKRVYNKYAKQAARTKEKRRDGDRISLIMSDTQPKGLLTLENYYLNFCVLHNFNFTFKGYVKIKGDYLVTQRKLPN